MRQEVAPRQGRLHQLAQALKQFLYGMTVYEMVRDLERERGRAQQRFAALALGSLVGLPVPANYYGLRLIPYAFPHLRAWERSVLRERDLTSLCDEDFS